MVHPSSFIAGCTSTSRLRALSNELPRYKKVLSGTFEPIPSRRFAFVCLRNLLRTTRTTTAVWPKSPLRELERGQAGLALKARTSSPLIPFFWRPNPPPGCRGWQGPAAPKRAGLTVPNLPKHRYGGQTISHSGAYHEHLQSRLPVVAFVQVWATTRCATR